MAHIPHDPNETPQICYAMAYFVLPEYIFNQADRILEMLAAGPKLGAAFYYAITCKMDDKEPRDDLIPFFNVHSGNLNKTNRYYIIEYPTPPRVNIVEMSDDQIMDAMQDIILAPYFSAVIENQQTKELKYFILGQSPDGHTTLRSVAPGMNANLGPGCEPKIESFVALLAERN